MTPATTSFDKALSALPAVCGFDAFSHKTVEDLCYLCLHELDLHAEQEYWHPVAVRKQLLAFCKKFGYYTTQAEEMYVAGNGLKKSDAYM